MNNVEVELPRNTKAVLADGEPEKIESKRGNWQFRKEILKLCLR